MQHWHLGLVNMATVLIIDDNDDVRNYLTRLVALFGYTPFCAATCEEARKLLVQEDPRMDVVVSDIYLPDGPEDAADWIREVKQKAMSRPLIVISGEAPDAMVEEFSASGDIMATLGPTISAAAYEVGPEFVARFREAGEDVARWFTPSHRAGHAMFDLPGYIVFRLERAGVLVTNLGLCTFSDEARFFSYRRMTLNREPDYGRHLAAIAIEGG